jgi:ABC-type lipoprotein export system ATPase subunit
MIRLERAIKVYLSDDMRVRTLREVDLTIRRSECVALMGRPRSGKSTAMNTVECLEVPASGRYRLHREIGMDISVPGRNPLPVVPHRPLAVSRSRSPERGPGAVEDLP